jgi:hypothetical protein
MHTYHILTRDLSKGMKRRTGGERLYEPLAKGDWRRSLELGLIFSGEIVEGEYAEKFVTGGIGLGFSVSRRVKGVIVTDELKGGGASVSGATDAAADNAALNDS